MEKDFYTRVIIFGCGGHARSITNIIRENDKDIEMLLVDENAKDNEIILGCRAERTYRLQENDAYIVAIGDNIKRKQLYDYLKNIQIGCCISVVSIYSHIGLGSRIGRGTFVAANAYIGPQAEIGDNVIVNTGSIVEHEVMIGNHTHIAPNATICGRTQIGNNVLCGAGSTIINNINVCDDVIIGAGSVIVDSIKEPGTYVGIPGKRIR